MNLEDIIRTSFTPDEATLLLEQINTVSKTQGDWVEAITLPGYHQGDKENLKKPDALSPRVIDEMLKSGIVYYAVEMKRAKIINSFQTKYLIKINTDDRKLERLAEYVIESIIPQTMFEASWSALVWGSAFMEKVWEYKSGRSIGIGGSTEYIVPKVPNLVPHNTISKVLRDKNGDFSGFIQTPHNYRYGDHEIFVPAEDAMVFTYNGYSRNIWGESFLAPLYPYWFWLEIVFRAMVQFSQMMGDPPRYGKAPSRRAVKVDSTTEVRAVDWLLTQLINLSKTNAIAIPSDVNEHGKEEWEIGFLKVPDSSQPFYKLIEIINEHLLRASLIGLETEDPNLLGADIHNQIIVSQWVSVLNRSLFEPLSLYNKGQGVKPVSIEIRGYDPRQQDFIKNIMAIAGNSKSFQDVFYEIDWLTTGKLSGIPMLSKEEKEELKAKLLEESLAHQKASFEIMQQNQNDPTTAKPTDELEDD